MEVGCLSRQRLIGSAQGFERGVPGISEHDKPDDPRHEGVVDKDKDDDTGESFCGPADKRHSCVTGILSRATYKKSSRLQ